MELASSVPLPVEVHKSPYRHPQMIRLLAENRKPSSTRRLLSHFQIPFQFQIPPQGDDAILHGKRPTFVHAAPATAQPEAESEPGRSGEDELSHRETLRQWRHLRRQEGRRGGQSGGGGSRGIGGGSGKPGRR